jgi:hypothetical protein
MALLFSVIMEVLCKINKRALPMSGFRNQVVDALHQAPHHAFRDAE